ncbi:hypothetical protein NXV67_19370 [Bacteroides fragilis]|nr:hypothetical protein NXV67_19370 [Bacteroides fragilis]
MGNHILGLPVPPDQFRQFPVLLFPDELPYLFHHFRQLLEAWLVQIAALLFFYPFFHSHNS